MTDVVDRLSAWIKHRALGCTFYLNEQVPAGMGRKINVRECSYCGARRFVIVEVDPATGETTAYEIDPAADLTRWPP